jgi:hypothetical protein
MKRSTSCAAVLALSFCVPHSARAGPWVPAPNEGYIKISTRWLPAFGWSPGPDPAEETTVEERALFGPYNEVFLGTYWEHGLLPHVAYWVAWEPVRLFILTDPRNGETRVHPGVGEPTLGLRANLFQKGPVAVGVEVAVTFPLLDNEPVNQVYSVAEGNPRIAEVRVGTGVWDVAPGFSIGAGWGRVYVTGGVGVKVRSGGWDTVLLWNAEVGRTMGKNGNGSLRLKLVGHHPLGDGEVPYHESVSGIGNGTSYAGFTVEYDRKVSDHWFLGASIAGGLGPVIRQAGGPVISLNVSAVY